MKIQCSLSGRSVKSAAKFTALAVSILSTAAAVSGQSPQPAAQSGGSNWWYLAFFVFGLAAAAIVWFLKAGMAKKNAGRSILEKEKMMAEDAAWRTSSPDDGKETDRPDRQQKSVDRPAAGSAKKNLAENLPQTGKIFNRAVTENGVPKLTENDSDEKHKSITKDALPIFNFRKLEPARPFAPLPISNDEALLSAVEQTQEEFEDDEEIRDLAVRILARFKNKNSVEALAQVALYDLSTYLRSRAVTILADFDHESVFETILLACADPTREVRAAAARGLFRLSFDRAAAWRRIAETNDEYRLRQAVLAVKEADLVGRSFDRLVHHDAKIAYEALTLLALMIRARETDEIFRAIETHGDDAVKLALLHAVDLTKDEETLARLYSILESPSPSAQVRAKIDEVILSFQAVAPNTSDDISLKPNVRNRSSVNAK